MELFIRVSRSLSRWISGRGQNTKKVFQSNLEDFFLNLNKEQDYLYITCFTASNVLFTLGMVASI